MGCASSSQAKGPETLEELIEYLLQAAEFDLNKTNVFEPPARVVLFPRDKDRDTYAWGDGGSGGYDWWAYHSHCKNLGGYFRAHKNEEVGYEIGHRYFPVGSFVSRQHPFKQKVEGNELFVHAHACRIVKTRKLLDWDNGGRVVHVPDIETGRWATDVNGKQFDISLYTYVGCTFDVHEPHDRKRAHSFLSGGPQGVMILRCLFEAMEQTYNRVGVSENRGLDFINVVDNRQRNNVINAMIPNCRTPYGGGVSWVCPENR